MTNDLLVVQSHVIPAFLQPSSFGVLANRMQYWHECTARLTLRKQKSVIGYGKLLQCVPVLL